MKLRALAAGGLALLASLFACGFDPPREDYVGVVQGSDAVIGIARRAKGVVAFVAGGDTSRAALSGWFSGRFRDDTGDTLELENGPLKLSLTITGSKVSGSLTAPSRAEPYPIVGGQQVEGTIAGLYSRDREGASCPVGAVVTQKNTAVEPTLQGAFCTAGGFDVVLPAGKIRLVNGTLEVALSRGSGERVLLLPAEPE